MRNMARNMYQKAKIQVDKIQKGHGTWADEAPEVFGTDQLEPNRLRDVMSSPDFPTISWLQRPQPSGTTHLLWICSGLSVDTAWINEDIWPFNMWPGLSADNWLHLKTLRWQGGVVLQ